MELNPIQTWTLANPGWAALIGIAFIAALIGILWLVFFRTPWRSRTQRQAQQPQPPAQRPGGQQQPPTPHPIRDGFVIVAILGTVAYSIYKLWGWWASRINGISIPWMWIGIVVGLIGLIALLIKFGAFTKMWTSYCTWRTTRRAATGNTPAAAQRNQTAGFGSFCWDLLTSKGTWVVIGVIAGAILIYCFRGIIAAPFVRFYTGEKLTTAMWVSLFVILGLVLAMLVRLGWIGRWNTLNLLIGLLLAAWIIYALPGTWEALHANVKAFAAEGPLANRFADSQWFHLGEISPTTWLIMAWLAALAFAVWLLYLSRGWLGPVVGTGLLLLVIAGVVYMLMEGLSSFKNRTPTPADPAVAEVEAKPASTIVKTINVNPDNWYPVTFADWTEIEADPEPDKTVIILIPGHGEVEFSHGNLKKEFVEKRLKLNATFYFKAKGDYMATVTFRCLPQVSFWDRLQL